MTRAVEYLEQELASVRTGRASPGHSNPSPSSCFSLSAIHRMTHTITFRTSGQLEGPSVWAEDAFESSSQHLCAGLSDLAGHSF